MSAATHARMPTPDDDRAGGSDPDGDGGQRGGLRLAAALGAEVGALTDARVDGPTDARVDGAISVGVGAPTGAGVAGAAVASGAARDDVARGEGPREPGPRVRLAPRSEPAAESLTVDAPLGGAPPVLGSPAALARRSRPDDRTAASAAPAAAGPTGEAALPDPTQLCCAIVQAAVEGLRGARPLAQLVRWVTPEVLDGLVLRGELVQRAGAPSATGRAGIRRIRVCRIGSHAAEATVVVDDGPRVRAVAVRLEGHRGRWRATAMEIG